MYGIDRLTSDLSEQCGYNVDTIKDSKGKVYALLLNFEIICGRFKDRIIDLAIPAPPEYPRVIGSSIHIKSEPHLLDFKDKVPNKKNIIKSPLGPEWRYWSFRFSINLKNPTLGLMAQINGIFKNV